MFRNPGWLSSSFSLTVGTKLPLPVCCVKFYPWCRQIQTYWNSHFPPVFYTCGHMCVHTRVHTHTPKRAYTRGVNGHASEFSLYDGAVTELTISRARGRKRVCFVQLCEWGVPIVPSWSQSSLVLTLSRRERLIDGILVQVRVKSIL